VPFEKKEFLTFLVCYTYLKNRSTHMKLSRLLSKHSADAANIQKSKSINHFNLCGTIWKVRIFEGTPVIRNSGKKSATHQKRWQISKNDLYRFDSEFSIESKNEIKLGKFHLKKHNFSVFIILRHTVYRLIHVARSLETF
jgi:hypothetical protein